jgi:DNA-binding SARP family transcriptional activator
VRRCLRTSPANASIVAELVADRLKDLSENTFVDLAVEVRRRPQRWQGVLRARISPEEGFRAAQLLDQVGTAEDVPVLRAISKRSRVGGQLGKGLAKRLAPPIRIEDQGRVTILVGDRPVAGSEIRRKVLTALCFLLSQPNFAAARDQVLEALWPDLDPVVAANSLNQTAYFLRRLFEPEYREETSPEYLHHDSELLWLDQELVSSRSSECWRLVRAASDDGNSEVVDRLVATYRGRFALDFEYEEWAASYRDALHAAYLQVVEKAVHRDTATGHFDRGIRLARAALEIDPSAEPLELSLLRLYRLSGAHAAAAEQYAHYANAMRNELGVQAPPLEEL